MIHFITILHVFLTLYNVCIVILLKCNIPFSYSRAWQQSNCIAIILIIWSINYTTIAIHRLLSFHNFKFAISTIFFLQRSKDVPLKSSWKYNFQTLMRKWTYHLYNEMMRMSIYLLCTLLWIWIFSWFTCSTLIITLLTLKTSGWY